MNFIHRKIFMMYSEQIDISTSLSLVCAKNLYIRERKIKKLRRRRERTKRKKMYREKEIGKNKLVQ